MMRPENRKCKVINFQFVNSPICCPSRSTILTGKFAHNTGVLNNSIEGNCSSRIWQKKHEPFSIAAILKETKNYLTFYAGKYLNTYGYERVGGLSHVPTGYDWWIGLQGNSKYYDYSLSVNGSTIRHSKKYLTDSLADYSMRFLNEKPPNKPFFMTIAPPAPHAPFTPAERHKNEFPDTKAIRNPSFNYTASDKHWLVGMPPKFLPENVTNLDNIQRHRLQSLLSVDEMVERIVQKLKEMKAFDDTYVIVTSDNGFHIGQFTQPWDKRQPYETDIRVPFIVSGPEIPRKTVEPYPISMVDLAPTILDLVGINIPSDMDGKSFKTRLFSEKSEIFKEHIFVEYWGEGRTARVNDACPWGYDGNVSECSPDQWCKCQDSKNNTYTCILDMTDDRYIKLCEFDDQQRFAEVYDLTVDPYELKNIVTEMDNILLADYHSVIKNFRTCRGKDCQL